MEDILPLAIDGNELGRPLIISGPCSAETEEQVLNTARGLARAGIKIFRAGIWKPRTKPGGFEGVGVPGLAWLNKVKEETGMKVATEVANRGHVEAALEYGIDLLWIGARTSANPFAMQEIADVLRESGKDIPVLVKNPVNPDLELWIGALERLYNAGIHRLGVIHRGFSTYGPQI
ncbi:MAG: 3-deoxy-7-phosphoheptulonate synthase, partial [Duncaniella sp.]|nr:3-deoxy-7-phosphoheptulonate synthase [Duncaniella sp.]